LSYDTDTYGTRSFSLSFPSRERPGQLMSRLRCLMIGWEADQESFTLGTSNC